MAHKTLINNTEYLINKGKSKINYTDYDIIKGKTMINGTIYDINFEGGNNNYLLITTPFNDTFGEIHIDNVQVTDFTIYELKPDTIINIVSYGVEIYLNNQLVAIADMDTGFGYYTFILTSNTSISASHDTFRVDINTNIIA